MPLLEAMDLHCRVYVAGPISGGGDISWNIDQAIVAGQRLWEAGFVPFIPHLDARWQYLFPKGRREWLSYDRHWLALCDVLLRLPGASPGSDQEVAWAEQLSLPVYYDIDQLIAVESTAERGTLGTHDLEVSPQITDDDSLPSSMEK